MESIEVLENELSEVETITQLTDDTDDTHHHLSPDDVSESHPGCDDVHLNITNDESNKMLSLESVADSMDAGDIDEVTTDNLEIDGTSSTDLSVGVSTVSSMGADQVIGLGLLLQNPETEDKNPEEEELPENSQMLQAVTFPDGTTAFIQHNKDLKLTEGQTLTLEDGTTAIVQNTTIVTRKETPPIIVEPPEQNKILEGQGISLQLEDGTMAYLQTAKGPDGLQAITLEDGTTAYIAHPNPDSLFGEATGLDGTLPNMEHIAQATTTADLLDDGEIKQEITDKGTIKIVDGDNQERNIPFGDKAFRCMFGNCGRLYTTLHHLKVHERSHTGDRPFKCDFIQCGKAFATGYGLKSHRRVHTGEKPYKCQETGCDKAFKTSGDLQKHVRTHTGERPFKCPFEGCTRSFTTSNIRKVHIRTHTGERPYTCDAEGCGRSFASATNYKNHVRIHTGEKPYVCTVAGCGKRFTEYSSLYKHHVVHTHSKPYECSHCGKTYRQTSTLAMHKRTSHGEDLPAIIVDAEAHLYNNAGEGEPDCKRSRIEFIRTDSGTQEDGEGMLVINTSEASNTSELDNVRLVPANPIQVSLPCLQQLQQQQTISGFTINEQGQQVLVVTDPVQLEALQASIQQITSQGHGTLSIAIAAPPSEANAEGTANLIATTDTPNITATSPTMTTMTPTSPPLTTLSPTTTINLTPTTTLTLTRTNTSDENKPEEEAPSIELANKDE